MKQRPTEEAVRELLESYAPVDVLDALATIMVEDGEGGDSAKFVAIGKVLKTLTDQSLWD